MGRTFLKKKIDIGKIDSMKAMISDLELNTICTEALCPNISECYGRNQAAFLILGKICTRNCSFCNVTNGKPARPNPDEPCRVAEAVRRLNLKHVLITSPARDDLADGGADMYVSTISALKNIRPVPVIEVLIPDFKEDSESIRKVVLNAAPDMIAHNLETVRRLYGIRKGADYKRSLNVLKKIKKFNLNMKTKSAIMLGLGETESEIAEFMKDLLDAGCEYLSMGQYLAPSRKHHPVQKFIDTERFDEYKEEALSMGFVHVESGPYVRSSYHAELYF